MFGNFAVSGVGFVVILTVLVVNVVFDLSIVRILVGIGVSSI